MPLRLIGRVRIFSIVIWTHDLRRRGLLIAGVGKPMKPTFISTFDGQDLDPTRIDRELFKCEFHDDPKRFVVSLRNPKISHEGADKVDVIMSYIGPIHRKAVIRRYIVGNPASTEHSVKNISQQLIRAFGFIVGFIWHMIRFIFSTLGKASKP